jgi:hypothetical protein
VTAAPTPRPGANQGYTVVVRGEVPPDLVERIEAAYAAALVAQTGEPGQVREAETV